MAATESNPIIFYDLKCKLPDTPASPHTWKIRLLLNYKQLPYKTIWVTWVEIEPTLRALGLEPLPGPGPGYQVPVIVDPTPSTSGSSPTIIRDSTTIAQYLERTYPDPARLIFPGGSHALQALFVGHLDRIMYFSSLPHIVVPLIPQYIDEASWPYFHRTREAFFGKPLTELRPKGDALVEAWGKVKADFDVIDAALANNDVARGGRGGDFFMGNQISYADIVLVGLFRYLRDIPTPEDGNSWNTIRAWHDGRWERLWKGLEDFMLIK